MRGLWKKILKDQKYSIKSRDSSCSGHLSLSLSLQLFICYNLTLLRGWQTDQPCQSGPKTGCTTYFARCLHLTAELSVGRRVIPVLSAWCKCTSPLTLLLVPTVNAPQEPHLYTNTDSVQQRFKHFPSVIFSSQCV